MFLTKKENNKTEEEDKSQTKRLWGHSIYSKTHSFENTEPELE